MSRPCGEISPSSSRAGFQELLWPIGDVLKSPTLPIDVVINCVQSVDSICEEDRASHRLLAEKSLAAFQDGPHSIAWRLKGMFKRQVSSVYLVTD